MDLIIKPTERCNFACTFCSSTELTDDKSKLLDLDKIFKFLDRFPDTKTIIVNGGDPLMLEPDYYWKILARIEEKKMPTILSFTTNLWDFYLKPEKWTPLFRHPQVGVATSFNYGTTRRITRNKIFDEDSFWKVSDLFLEKVGYRPDFISVINDLNEDTAIENVKLAKRMNVVCKLNYAMSSGRETAPFQLSKIYKIYLEIFDSGLADWEFNTKEMLRGIAGFSTICPRNRSCDSGIRCLQPDGDYYSCGAFGDDKEYSINFEEEMSSDKILLPLHDDPSIQSLKEECYGCSMFNLCNGCHKTIKDMKRAQIVDSHCSLMKKMESKILQTSLQTFK